MRTDDQYIMRAIEAAKTDGHSEGYDMGKHRGYYEAACYLETSKAFTAKKQNWQVSLDIKAHLIEAEAVSNERQRILDGLAQFKDYDAGIEALINNIS